MVFSLNEVTLMKHCLFFSYTLCVLSVLFSLDIPQAYANPTDVWIRAEISSSFLRPRRGLLGVRVEVKDRVVTLTGKVRNDEARENAAKLARSVPGVRKVVNAIEVDPSLVRGRGEQTGDAAQAARTAESGFSWLMSRVYLLLGLIVVGAVALFIYLARRTERAEKALAQQFLEGPEAKTYYSMTGFVNSIRRRSNAKED